MHLYLKLEMFRKVANNEEKLKVDFQVKWCENKGWIYLTHCSS